MAGRIRGAILLNGHRYDQIVMDVLRSELEFRHMARFRDLERAAGATPPRQPMRPAGVARAGVVHTTRKDSRQAAPDKLD